MSLRHRLTWLLISFAALAVLSASATIYGIKLEVESAAGDFRTFIDQTDEIHHLRRMLREQVSQLYEIIDGHRVPTESYFIGRDAFIRKLRHSGRVAVQVQHGAASEDLFLLSRQVEDALQECMALAGSADTAGARALLTSRIKGELMPKIDARLGGIERRLGACRDRSVMGLVATTNQVLILALVVGLLAAALVIVGTALVRKWLFGPLLELHQATEQLRQGDYALRLSPQRQDELGRLGTALVGMAQSVSDAQNRLTASEAKHRALFEKLRDAVVIVDAQARVIEYHDSETGLLGVEGNAPLGRRLVDVWSEWQTAVTDWPELIKAVVRDGRRYRANDVELRANGQTGQGAVVDLIVFRVEYSQTRYAVIILRDITERHRLQTRLREAETMEAVGTLAGGMAHDFNNALSGVIGTLSGMEGELGDSQYARQIAKALHGCRQASGLARRLLHFARGTHGDPQILDLCEVVELIIQSLDEASFERIEVKKNLAEHVLLRMDQDQLTHAVLNLISNARDAMDQKGQLFISVDSRMTCNPDEDRKPRRYARLIVRDTGIGMNSEVKRRVFEPFFTTKARGVRSGRGMGMAMVYSTVRNAGGFIQIDSEPGMGTTVKLHLPAVDDPVQSQAQLAADPSYRTDSLPSR